MKKHVVIVHGYKSKPETSWKPWLKHELEAKNFRVDVPAMPNAEHPVASEWVARLTETVGEPHFETYLIGHSLGCITILRYLERLPEDQRIGGVILVAGFGERFQRYTSGSHDTFFDHDLDWSVIRTHCDGFVAIHSEDDPSVEPAQLDVFKDKLEAKTLLVQGGGHFSSADGAFKIPLVRDELLAMALHRTQQD